MIPPCLCPMPNVEYLPLSEKAILEICKTHAPDLYARVMRLAADFVHESVRYTNAQAAQQSISGNPAGKTNKEQTMKKQTKKPAPKSAAKKPCASCKAKGKCKK